MKVSTFQGHLHGRIDKQAKLVEKGWLGSADHISKELNEKLSQVWILLRDDDMDGSELPGALTQPLPSAAAIHRITNSR